MTPLKLKGLHTFGQIVVKGCAITGPCSVVAVKALARSPVAPLFSFYTFLNEFCALRYKFELPGSLAFRVKPFLRCLSTSVGTHADDWEHRSYNDNGSQQDLHRSIRISVMLSKKLILGGSSVTYPDSAGLRRGESYFHPQTAGPVLG